MYAICMSMSQLKMPPSPSAVESARQLSKVPFPEHLAKQFCRIRAQSLRNCDELRDVDLALVALNHSNHGMGSLQDGSEIALRQIVLFTCSSEHVGSTFQDSELKRRKFQDRELSVAVWLASTHAPRTSHRPITFCRRAVGLLASPRRRAELHRTGPPRGCRGSACPYSCWRRVGPVVVTCHGKKPL